MIKHGHARKRGLRTPEHRAWGDMKGRCMRTTHARYADWGGRGIKVCKRWMKFENFLADMGERPVGTTLDRKNNNGNYTKSNCRWATWSEQCANRRLSPSTIYVRGKTLRQWEKKLGVKYETLRLRYKRTGDVLITRNFKDNRV